MIVCYGGNKTYYGMVTGNLRSGARSHTEPKPRCQADHPSEPRWTLGISFVFVAIDKTLDFHTWHLFTQVLSWKNNSAAYSKHPFLLGRGVLWCSSKFEDHRYNLPNLNIFFDQVLCCLFKKVGGKTPCYCRVIIVSARRELTKSASRGDNK